MLDGLAFLPIADVPEGMQYIRDRVPDIGDDDGRLADLIDYFDSTYVKWVGPANYPTNRSSDAASTPQSTTFPCRQLERA